MIQIPRVRPFKHRLLVHAFPPPEETKTEAGLIITRRAREREIETGVRARVEAVGPGCHPDFTPGTWLLIPRFTGTEILHDAAGDPNSRFLIILEDTVICWIDEEEALKQVGLGA